MKVRNVLWDNPHLIIDYLNTDKRLTQVEQALLRSWSKHHIRGNFFIVKHEPRFSVFFYIDEKVDRLRLYAVKGINSSISAVIQRKLPYFVDTVLLPVGNKIIYDGFLITSTEEIEIASPGELKQIYNIALMKYGLKMKLPKLRTKKTTDEA